MPDPVRQAAMIRRFVPFGRALRALLPLIALTILPLAPARAQDAAELLLQQGPLQRQVPTLPRQIAHLPLPHQRPPAPLQT
uniref:hypothetical protein n=1 Tax=uncultured Alsobacter sp. TaxID=1748258 RepID=UPI0025F658EF